MSCATFLPPSECHARRGGPWLMARYYIPTYICIYSVRQPEIRETENGVGSSGSVLVFAVFCRVCHLHNVHDSGLLLCTNDFNTSPWCYRQSRCNQRKGAGPRAVVKGGEFNSSLKSQKPWAFHGLQLRLHTYRSRCANHIPRDPSLGVGRPASNQPFGHTSGTNSNSRVAACSPLRFCE